MRKKFLLAALSAVCVTACAICVSACKKSAELSELKVAYGSADAEYSGDVYLGEYEYGNTDALEADLAELRFVYGYTDGSEKEVSADTLGVCYKSPDNGDALSSEIYDELPENVFFGSWIAYYYVNGHKPTLQSVSSYAVSVGFTVTKSANGAFTLEMSETQLQYGKTSEVEITVKNASGAEVEQVSMGGNLTKIDDTDYYLGGFYYMEKDYYNTLTDAQKKNYSDMISMEYDEQSENYGYNKAHGRRIGELTLTGTDGGEYHWGFENIKPGEYVLLGCIEFTFNYEGIVTDGCEFTVAQPESPLGNTFVLKDIEGYNDSGEKVDADSEIAAIVENLKTQNSGKTLICTAEGKVEGTCDLGFGVLGELTDNKELSISFNADDLSVVVSNNDGVNMTGGYTDQTLVLIVQRQTEGDVTVYYSLRLVFEKQSA